VALGKDDAGQFAREYRGKLACSLDTPATLSDGSLFPM
jgi:hypothetical protein